MQPGQTTDPGSNQDLPQEATDLTRSREDPSLPNPVSSEEPQFSEETESQFSLNEPPTNQPELPSQVSWTASEYISHAKGPAWFILLGLALFSLVGLIFFTTKDIVASVLVGIAGLTFGVFAARPPQVLEYAINNTGITIGRRNHPFHELKSFAVIDNGVIPSLMLLPLKRFMPPITVFYDPNEEEKIVNMLAAYLPHEEKEPDFIDKLMGHIRF